MFSRERRILLQLACCIAKTDPVLSFLNKVPRSFCLSRFSILHFMSMEQFKSDITTQYIFQERKHEPGTWWGLEAEVVGLVRACDINFPFQVKFKTR